MFSFTNEQKENIKKILNSFKNNVDLNDKSFKKIEKIEEFQDILQLAANRGGIKELQEELKEKLTILFKKVFEETSIVSIQEIIRIIDN